MFPRHHQVPLYFAKHIYADFFLDMHPNYTSTPLSFYGTAGGGHSHVRLGARRDPGAQPEPEPLFTHPAKTMLRTDDVARSSQLAYEEWSALAEVTRMTMHGTMMVVHVERHRAPIAHAEPEI